MVAKMKFFSSATLSFNLGRSFPWLNIRLQPNAENIHSFILVNHTGNLYFSLETVKNSEEIFRLHTRYLVCNYQFDNNKTLVRFSVQLLSPYSLHWLCHEIPKFSEAWLWVLSFGHSIYSRTVSS